MKLRTSLVVFFSLMFLLGGNALFSQETSEEKRIKTVEELFFEDPHLGSLLEQAISINRESKLLALTDIKEMLDGGNVSNPDLVFDILELLSAEGARRQVREENRLINYYPIVRQRATQLIGRMGKELGDADIMQKSKNTLISILVSDEEVMVKSEAAFALGNIAFTDEYDLKEVIGVLSDIIQTQSTVAPDNNYAYATILAIDAIAKNAKGVNSYKAYSALIKIVQSNYTKKVKDKAYEVMQNLKSY